MASKRKSKVGTDSKESLPKTIELICSRTARVREFDTDHAQRILEWQLATKLGNYTIFNTELYQFDEGSRSIKLISREPQGSEGNTLVEFADRE